MQYQQPIIKRPLDDSPDLGVTHEPFLEPNSQPMCLQLGKVVVVPDVVHVGGITVENGISVLVVGKTPSVVDAIKDISTASQQAKGVLAYIKQTLSFGQHDINIGPDPKHREISLTLDLALLPGLDLLGIPLLQNGLVTLFSRHYL
jgi:hypothetical protein